MRRNAARQVDRALRELAELQQKLGSPRSRYQERAKVAAAVETILESRGAGGWITTTIEERVEEKYHQEGRGRPSEKTRYIKEVITRFELRSHRPRGWRRNCGDGVFPLITNDRTLSERELLLAYKGQPVIEKRFAQLKTDFAVAPVYLKEVSRIQALLCVYFRVAGGVPAGAGTPSRDGPRGDRKLAAVPRGPRMSPPDGPASDRRV